MEENTQEITGRIMVAFHDELEKIAVTIGQSRLLGSIAMGTVGAAVGATVSPKNRKKGALIGGGTGALIGIAGTPALLKRTKWAKRGKMYGLFQGYKNPSTKTTFPDIGVIDGKRVRTKADHRRAMNEASAVSGLIAPGKWRKGDLIRFRRRGRGMVVDIHADRANPRNFDDVGRIAGSAWSRKTRFGETPEEFIRTAYIQATRHTPVTYPPWKEIQKDIRKLKLSTKGSK